MENDPKTDTSLFDRDGLVRWNGAGKKDAVKRAGGGLPGFGKPDP